MMGDMSAVIVPKSDQWNADDFISGPITVTIKGVSVRPGTEQPVSIDIGTPGKVFRPCKSMARVMVSAWGADSSKYAGRSMTLYRDPKVKWGGMEVGGIRISHMSHIDAVMILALTETKQSRKPFTVKPLAIDTKRQDLKPAAPQPDSPPPIEDGDLTFADRWDKAVDEATVAADLHRDFSQAMKTADWDALKDADPARATALKVKVTARVAELKGGS